MGSDDFQESRFVKVLRGAANHRKFRKLARALGITRFEAFGLTAAMWDWVDATNPFGTLELAPQDIADSIGIEHIDGTDLVKAWVAVAPPRQHRRRLSGPRLDGRRPVRSGGVGAPQQVGERKPRPVAQGPPKRRVPALSGRVPVRMLTAIPARTLKESPGVADVDVDARRETRDARE